MRELAARYGTPLFLYSAEVARRKLQQLREAFSNLEVYYSVKANPAAAYLRCFVQQSCGLEAASPGEIHQALASGCPPQRIVYAGPGKTEEDLEYALAQGVGAIHAESLGELRRVAAIAGRREVRAPVAVRVNPDAAVQGGAMRMGGKPTPFGIDEEQLPTALDFIKSAPTLDFLGVHVFSGTQILDAAVLLSQYRRAAAIAIRAAEHLGARLRSLDFGGGLGVPIFAAEQELDLAAVRQGLGDLSRELRRHPLLASARCMIEPGRFLVSESGVYAARVVDVKTSRGKTFVITDGGMHHHLAASGNLGQTIKRNFPVAVLNKLDQPSAESANIVGPLCTPLDMLARSAAIPAVEPGDLIGVFQSGAYARSASPLGFLSHVSPPEVWIEKGRDQLIRRRGQRDDFLRDQVDEA